MNMLQKLYSLKEPTKNGVELASRMAKEINTIKSDILKHRDNVIEIHPKLSFLINDNPGMLKLASDNNKILNALIFEKIKVVQSAINEQQATFSEMENVLRMLKNTKVDKSFLSKNPGFEQSDNQLTRHADETETNNATLYDYIDEQDLNALMGSIMNTIENFQDQLSKLFFAQKKVDVVPEKLESCDSGSLSIKAQDITDIQKKIDFNIELADQFSEDFESLILHNNQLNQVIAQIQEDNMELSDQDYAVLSHDTQEIGLIVGEMQDTLASLRQVVDEIHVKSQQYSSFFEEHKSQTVVISQSFKLIYDSIADLTLISENINMLHSQFTNFLSEMWNLTAWYQEFLLAYDQLVLEMNRRSVFKQKQKEWIGNILEELDTLNIDETNKRINFLQTSALYLPSDLCPEIHNVPEKFEFVQVGVDEFEPPSIESVQLASESVSRNDQQR